MGVLEDVLGVNTQKMSTDDYDRPVDPYNPIHENEEILEGEYVPAYGYHANHIVQHVQHAQSTEFAPSDSRDRERLYRHLVEHLREWLIEGKEKTKGPPTMQEAMDEVLKASRTQRSI